MNTQTTTQTTQAAPVIEESTGRHCYCYILFVNGRPYSACTAEWWNTPEQMLSNSSGMAVAARVFRHSAGVGVYELRNDDHFHFTHSCALYGTGPIPEKFPRNECPVKFRGGAN